MKLSRERKIYIAVFGLALAVLGADRFVFSPSDASAADQGVLLITPPSVGASAAPSAPRTTTSASSPAGPESVTRLLDSIRRQRDLQLDQVPDAFASRTPSGPGPSHHRQIRANSLIEQFSRHKLASVSPGGRGGASAMIGGQIIHVGQTFDRFKLIAVDSTSALFECEDVQVRLMLNGESKASIHFQHDPATSPPPAADR